MKHYYAKYYRYGVNMLDANSGEQIYTAKAFRTRAERDNWVNAGDNSDWSSQPNFREACKARQLKAYEREYAHDEMIKYIRYGLM